MRKLWQVSWKAMNASVYMSLSLVFVLLGHFWFSPLAASHNAELGFTSDFLSSLFASVMAFNCAITLGSWGLALPVSRRRQYGLRVVLNAAAFLPAGALTCVTALIRPWSHATVAPAAFGLLATAFLVGVTFAGFVPIACEGRVRRLLPLLLLLSLVHAALLALALSGTTAAWLSAVIAAPLAMLAYDYGLGLFERWEPGAGSRHVPVRDSVVHGPTVSTMRAAEPSGIVDAWPARIRFLLRGVYSPGWWMILFATGWFSVWVTADGVSTRFTLLCLLFVATDAAHLVNYAAQEHLTLSFRRERNFDVVFSPVFLCMLAGFAIMLLASGDPTQQLSWENSNWRCATDRTLLSAQEEGDRRFATATPPRLPGTAPGRIEIVAENFRRDFAMNYGVYPEEDDVRQQLATMGRVEPARYASLVSRAGQNIEWCATAACCLACVFGAYLALPGSPRSWRRRSATWCSRRWGRSVVYVHRACWFIALGGLALYAISCQPVGPRPSASDIVARTTVSIDWTLDARLKVAAGKYGLPFTAICLTAAALLHLRNRRAFRWKEVSPAPVFLDFRRRAV